MFHLQYSAEWYYGKKYTQRRKEAVCLGLECQVPSWQEKHLPLSQSLYQIGTLLFRSGHWKEPLSIGAVHNYFYQNLRLLYITQKMYKYKKRTLQAHDVLDIFQFATHASLVYDIIDTDCLAWNGSTHECFFCDFQTKIFLILFF